METFSFVAKQKKPTLKIVVKTWLKTCSKIFRSWPRNSLRQDQEMTQVMTKKIQVMTRTWQRNDQKNDSGNDQNLSLDQENSTGPRKFKSWPGHDREMSKKWLKKWPKLKIWYKTWHVWKVTYLELWTKTRNSIEALLLEIDVKSGIIEFFLPITNLTQRIWE